MSDRPEHVGWWQASDGKWYPPGLKPGKLPPTIGDLPPPPTTSGPPAGPSRRTSAEDGNPSIMQTIRRMSVGQRIVAGIAGFALALCLGSLFIPVGERASSARVPAVAGGLPSPNDRYVSTVENCKAPILVWTDSDASYVCEDGANEAALQIVPFAVVMAVGLGITFALISLKGSATRAS